MKTKTQRGEAPSILTGSLSEPGWLRVLLPGLDVICSYKDNKRKIDKNKCKRFISSEFYRTCKNNFRGKGLFWLTVQGAEAIVQGKHGSGWAEQAEQLITLPPTQEAKREHQVGPSYSTSKPTLLKPPSGEAPHPNGYTTSPSRNDSISWDHVTKLEPKGDISHSNHNTNEEPAHEKLHF